MCASFRRSHRPCPTVRCRTAPGSLRSGRFRARGSAGGARLPRLLPRLPGIDLVFVCTGNICRSAVATAHLRRRAAEEELPIRVSSAGFVLEGESPPDATRRAGARYDLDLDDHLSRIIDAAMVAAADLVVVMTNQHARQVLELVPEARRRVFTLKELVRTASDIEPRGEDEDLDTWLGRLDDARPASPHLGRNSDNDIDDPYGRSDRVHRRVASEVVGLVEQLLKSMLPERESTR